MKRFLLLFILVCTCLITHAVVVQQVYLKNGTILNGYIQQQDKHDNITFRTESATICIDGKNTTITEKGYKIAELDKKWIEWAENNDVFNGVGDNRTLMLNEIILTRSKNIVSKDSVKTISTDTILFENNFKSQHTNVVKVKVLEKGTTIKYLELTPNTYTFNWKDVEYIKADRRPKTALSGIDRVYQLKNGQEIRGQYAGETYNTLSIYTDGGMIETIDIDNAIKYFYKGINPNQSLFEQSELIDIVRTKNSGTFRGIIVERNFTEGNNYLVIQQQSGSSQIVKFADVMEYSKEDNAEYDPQYDVLLKHGEVMVNRMPADTVGVVKQGTIVVLDKVNEKLIVPKTGNTTKVVVEYYNPQHLLSDHFIMVKIDKAKFKKKDIYCFSTDIYEMKKFVSVKAETSVNHITKLEYDLPGSGVFAIYDQQTKMAMPFIIK